MPRVNWSLSFQFGSVYLAAKIEDGSSKRLGRKEVNETKI